MEKREEALLEALTKNAEETVRWQNYLQENEQAIANLDMFSKYLAVDVMVPIGRKALTPGQLIHTNEVMVGHYQNYFSKCSAHTAKVICNHRIEKAKTHLEELKTEAELWQNNLDKPYLDGVVPTEEQREIIEDYDEEQEMHWRVEHKKRAKMAKLRENENWRKEILAKEAEEQLIASKEAIVKVDEKEKTDEEILKMLEQAEMMEELEKELDGLEVDGNSDEILSKLLSGEMKLPPPKPRVTHTIGDKGKDVQMEIIEPNSLQGVIKKTAIPVYPSLTNNNIRANPELLQRVFIEDGQDGNESDDSVTSDTPGEVQVIEEQAKFLSNSDQIGFYEYQLQIVEQKLRNCAINSNESIEEKLHLFKVRSHLEELLELAAEAVGKEELAAQESRDEAEEEKEFEKEHKQKRRISFASEDYTLEFHKNEAVAEMLPKFDNKTHNRDVISLDDDSYNLISEAQTEPQINKKEIILNKVKENLKFVAEHQSTHDFDLVNKIINAAEGVEHTLHISFKHSEQNVNNTNSLEYENKEAQFTVPGTPADLYRMVFPLEKEEPSTLFMDSYEGEENVKTPVLEEKYRKEAYRDLRMDFSNPTNSLGEKELSSVPDLPKDVPTNHKSILRNKNAVDSETHALNTQCQANKENENKKSKKNKKAQPFNEDDCMSAYFKVMNDVVEKPLTEPEPLPPGKYIDAHTPKKRISRFKQMRTVADKV